jgi:hypothetical protein
MASIAFSNVSGLAQRSGPSPYEDRVGFQSQKSCCLTAFAASKMADNNESTNGGIMGGVCSNEVASIASLFANGRLPPNRKEVYFTATVLPGIICADNFENFDKFLELLKIPKQPHPKPEEIQFFTEYAFVHTVESDDPHLEHFHGKHQQPDILISIGGESPVLILIEGKMYTPAGKYSLTKQMTAQEKELLFWVKKVPKPELCTPRCCRTRWRRSSRRLTIVKKSTPTIRGQS